MEDSTVGKVFYLDLMLDQAETFEEQVRPICDYLISCKEHKDMYYCEISSALLKIMGRLNEAFLSHEIVKNKTDMGFIQIFRNLTPTKKIDVKTYVYIMKNNANLLSKIGMSFCPLKRRRTLSSYEGSLEIKLLFEFFNRDTARAFEKLLHEKYKSRKVHGEWFNILSDEIEGIEVLYKEHIDFIRREIEKAKR